LFKKLYYLKKEDVGDAAQVPRATSHTPRLPLRSNKKNPLNYLQPTESQKTKLQGYDQYRNEKRATMAAKGKEGYGGNAQRGRPLSTNMHGTPPADEEDDEELNSFDKLQKMRDELLG
jgi:hypothetical protein